MVYTPANYNWTVETGREEHSGSYSADESTHKVRYIVRGEYVPSPTTVHDAWGQDTQVERAIYSLSGIPQLYDPLFTGSGLLAKTRTHIRLAASPIDALYAIDVEYSTATESEDEERQADDPEDLPTKWSFGSFTVRMSLNEDLDQNSIETTAGEKFQNPPQVAFVGHVWRANLYKAVGALDLPDHKRKYEGKVHDHTLGDWNGYDLPGEVLLESITGREETKNGAEYWNITYVFKTLRTIDVNDVVNGPNGTATHDPVYLLNAGYYEKTAEGIYRRMQDDATPPRDIVTPHMLHEAGHRAEDGDPPKSLAFRMREKANLNALGLVIPGQQFAL